MDQKRLGRQTVALAQSPVITAWASIVGKLEGEGPLGHCFDSIGKDSYFGQDSWEKGESEMLKQAFRTACRKGNVTHRIWTISSAVTY